VIALVLAAALAAEAPMVPPTGPPITSTAPAVAAKGPVVVTARAVPDTTTIGSPVRYEVEVSVAKNVEVVLGQPADHLGPFEVVDFGEDPPVTRDGRRIVTRWFSLVGFDVGNHLVTSPPVEYRTSGSALVKADPVETRISIESLVGKKLADAHLRDIAPPMPIPIDWRGPEAVAGGVALLLAAVGGIWWLRRRRARRAVGPPPVAPDVRAVAALAALEARRLPERGEVKLYYAELSDVVRCYLEDRFGVRAPEMTTEEFLVSTARGGALGAAHRGLLGDFLRECDLVKFARHRPTEEAAVRAMAAARRFVAETRPTLGEEAA
jgi:hypothetical protein